MTQEDKLMIEKIDAIISVVKTCNQYESEGFDADVVATIVHKKIAMIIAATTIKDVREIVAPPKIYFDGNEWVTSEHSVMEEEAIMWSKASLRAPLTDSATDRYMTVMSQICDGKFKDLMRRIGGKHD